jgi:threonyl-tRNA synthetase
VAILPFNEEGEIKDYCQKLARELNEADIRVKIFSKKKLKDRIRQMYQKKIPYYLVIGKQEVEKNILKVMYTYQEGKGETMSQKELYNKLKKENKIQVS